MKRPTMASEKIHKQYILTSGEDECAIWIQQKHKNLERRRKPINQFMQNVFETFVIEKLDATLYGRLRKDDEPIEAIDGWIKSNNGVIKKKKKKFRLLSVVEQCTRDVQVVSFLAK